MSLAEADISPAERRALPRQPTTLRGRVFPGNLDCTVRDYNERGARLQFSGAAPEDDQFILVMWSTGQAFEGQVRWRGGQETGVLFLRSCDFRGRTPSFFWTARAEWLRSRPKLPRRTLKVRSTMIGANSAPQAVPTPSYMLKPRD
jgi:hypothetical protein